ncbi:hypothetical protein EDEG_01340 [Edhazardia aedis USNM 41457]|uniref:Uncharacterized protein n=1 Tax=Edhazardia aedis (strain USNM 41457) TaxID=1003232 RepID=J9DPJ0_EDHAE|nr:hypothetical protein EDEG_01340 [Edhazardia aedis USNM 41457]|eukprot:EJW04470.1 hypothetical protein EDEG_01340 [Edhazardia aedis USNM 41457]
MDFLKYKKVNFVLNLPKINYILPRFDYSKNSMLKYKNVEKIFCYKKRYLRQKYVEYNRQSNKIVVRKKRFYPVFHFFKFESWFIKNYNAQVDNFVFLNQADRNRKFIYIDSFENKVAKNVQCKECNNKEKSTSINMYMEIYNQKIENNFVKKLVLYKNIFEKSLCYKKKNVKIIKKKVRPLLIYKLSQNHQFHDIKTNIVSFDVVKCKNSLNKCIEDQKKTFLIEINMFHCCKYPDFLFDISEYAHVNEIFNENNLIYKINNKITIYYSKNKKIGDGKFNVYINSVQKACNLSFIKSLL